MCFIFILDVMMRSVGRFELLYENQSRCIIFLYLARARILHVAKETVVFFFIFFPFERFRYRSLIHRVRVLGQSGTRTDASAPVHFWINLHTLHIILNTASGASNNYHNNDPTTSRDMKIHIFHKHSILSYG